MRVTIAIVAALVFIAVATLLPGPVTVSTPPHCLICGDRGLADAILNLTLFAPLGAALAFQGVRAWRIPLAGFAVSMLVELVQLLIPGRDPSAGDLLFNTAGAVLGAGAPFLLRQWRSVRGTRARWWAATLALAATMVVMSAAVLLRPALPRLVYYGQWTPEFGNTEQYGGHVVSADIGDLKIRNRAIARSNELRSRLLQGETLRLRATAGAVPQSNSPVFNIYDETQHEVLSVMAEGRDLSVRYRMQASRLRLDQPTFLLREALGDVHPNKPWSLDLRLVDGGVCARVGERAECPLAFSLSRGWSVLLHTTFPGWLEILLDVVWLAILFLPAGSFIYEWRAGIAPVVVCIAGLLASDITAGLLPVRFYELLAAIAGILAGAAIRGRARRFAT